MEDNELVLLVKDVFFIEKILKEYKQTADKDEVKRIDEIIEKLNNLKV